MIASAVTLGTGGSGGREGPIAQIGAGFGSFLATKMKLSNRDRRLLLAAGMGAGVGAIFRAPLAGALFSAEILYKDEEFEADVIMPSAMASIVAYSVFSMSLPADKQFMPLFGNIDFAIGSTFELIPLAGLAFILTLAGIAYVKCFYGTHRLFAKLPVYPQLRPVVGALAAGGLGVGLYLASGRNIGALSVLSTGYGVLQDALDPSRELVVGLLLLVAVGKILTTSLTIGSGGSGGVFGPSMVIGGCLGGAVGQSLHNWWPELVEEPKAYVIVGMAGFFAGCARAPISTLIMVSEMTGDYRLLLPVMWVSTLCFLLCRGQTLYEKQVSNRLHSPAHLGDFLVDVLGDIRVAEVFQADRKIELITESTSLDDIVHLVADTGQNYFPVTDEVGNMVGIFSSNDVRRYLYDEQLWNVAIARDIMVSEFLFVTPEDDLNMAMRRFTQRNIDELPVMDSENETKLLGLLRRKDVIARYNDLRDDRAQRAADHR